MCYFQPEFHLSKHYDNKFIRPDLESPWSVDFKTTITFKFTTHSSWVLACQRYFTIPSRCAEMAKNRQKMPDFTWNSTNLKVPKVQKKIYPHFLHTKRHSKNTSHLTKSNFCFFQHYLVFIFLSLWFIFVIHQLVGDNSNPLLGRLWPHRPRQLWTGWHQRVYAVSADIDFAHSHNHSL